MSAEPPPLRAPVDAASAWRRYAGPLAVLLGLLAVYMHPLVPAAHTGTLYLAVHGLMTAGMLLIWRQRSLSATQVLVLACVVRVALLPAPFLSSNDTERYLWDGAVAMAGLDPYRVAPDSPEAQALRALWPTPSEHAAYPTLYPPGALALFAGSAWLGGPDFGVWVWKALATAAGLAAVLLMFDVMRRRALIDHFPLFALSPLLILETGIGGHLDGVSVLSITAAFTFWDRGRYLALGAALGVGATIKILPVTLVGPLLFFLPLRDGARVLAGAVMALVAIYGGAVSIGWQSFGILPEFLEKWRFGSPVYSALEALHARTAPVLAATGILLFYSGAAALAWRRAILPAMAVTLAAPLVFGPVVFPWYLCVLVPLLALRPSAVLLAWTSVAPLGYVVLNRWASEGVWAPALWPTLLIAVAWTVGLTADWQRPLSRVVPTSAKAPI